MKSCQGKRPYDLRKRQASSDRNRSAVVQAARGILEREGFLQFSMAAIAKESGLTRQTVHNLFGTKVDVIEALFDDMAQRAGMQSMQFIMQQSDAARMTSGYLRLMVSLWSQDHVLIRRIRGLRAIDPELESALHRRDERKQKVIGRILDMIDRQQGYATSADQRQYHHSILYAFTSFEVYEQLAESLGSEEGVTKAVLHAVGQALDLDLLTAPEVPG